jgi:multidrug efflux pump
MSPSTPFIMRPVATSLLMISIVLVGLVAFRFLPLSALPEVDYPTIQVQTFYPGASPDVMARTVTAPLERQFGQMADLNRMSSSSSGGASVVTLQFNLSLSLDVAEQEVQAAINAAGNVLPADLPSPPVYAKVNPADAPILTLALTSKVVPLTEVQDLAEQRLALKISQIGGVGLVTLSGGQRPAVRILVNTDALSAYGLTMEQLRTAIGAANTSAAKGSFDGPTRSFSINANDQLPAANDYLAQIIAYKNGAPVRLRDVARAVEGAENTQLGAWAGITPAIILNVQRQPGANVINTVDQIKKQLPELEAGIPQGIDVSVLTDRTTGIRASVQDVEFELVLAVILVVLVIFLFLRSVPATIIAGVAVPVSLIGAFAAMYLLGYSLNNLTLMGLTIASGFVVDDAIVMIENISRYVEEGEKPFEAALKGAGQIGFTIISLTVSLIAVLIPLLFMGDVIGRLFREFAVTLAVTIVISAVVSLTLTPMLSARWLRPEAEENKDNKILQRVHDWFEAGVAHYDRALQWVLDRERPTLIVAAATLVLTVLLYIAIPKGLFPLQDTGVVQGVTEASQSVSYARMASLQQQLSGLIAEDRDVASVSSFIGVDGANTTLNAGRMLINLKPQGRRSASLDAILERFRNDARQIPGMQLFLLPVQDLTVDATAGATQYQFAVEGADQTTVTNWAGRIVERLQSVGQVRNVASDVQEQGLSAYVDIDRDVAARLGVTPATIDEALYDAFGQRIISTIFTQSSQYRVILQAESAGGASDSLATLENLHVLAGNGDPIPLSAFATIRQQLAPLQVVRVAQFPAANISFDTAPGVSLSAAVDAVRNAEADLHVPASITTTFLGAANAFQASIGNELWLIIAAIITVYIVLGVLYESYIHPLTILSTLPSAGLGALVALMLAGQSLGVIGIIGVILLIGIVKKNAIMMIDFALQAEREEGKSSRQAIHQAALLRFRPIMMTTFAALFAALPLMLGWGEGSELRRPLGLAIVGGLLLSQLLTLFTTPVIYVALDDAAARLKQRLAKRDRPALAPPDAEPEPSA